MIYLYDSTETDFRYNGKPLPNSYDVTVHYTLNGEYYVNGKYPLDNKNTYKEIIEDRIVKVHTMDGMQPFRIVNVSKHELYVELEAWPLFYADMRNKLVKPLTLRGVNGQAALNAFVNNLLIDTPFNFYSDITGTHDYHTQDEDERENNPKQLYNALDILKDIANRWGGELWVRGYDIRINNRIGTDTEAMLYEKKNISEFVDTTNIEGIVTRLHGISEWTGEREEGQDEAPEHRIETTIDSPLINNYSGVIFEKQYRNNDARTKKELEDWLRLKFTTENIDKPQRTIEVGTHIVDGTSIKIGDTLVLKYVKHDVDMRIKVVGYEYDGFADKVIRVILGEPKSTSSSTIGNTITDLVNDIVSPVDRKSTIAMNSADGKNTVFHGTADPNTLNLNAKENDTYFRTNGSEKEIWRFTGTLWELIMDTSENTKVAEDVLEAKGIAETARDNALNVATDLMEGTSFYKHTQDIGLASKNSDGTINSIINLGSDGTAYVGGENIVLDGNTIVDGTFTITDKMIAPNAEIDGAKIQDATIGSAKIASLDVGKISGNTSNFVQTAWNNAVGSGVSIDGSGIHAMSANTDLQIRNGGITARGRNDDNSTYFGINGIRLENGAFFERLSSVSDGMEWSAPGFLHLSAWGSRQISLYSGGPMLFKSLDMNLNRITSVSRLDFQSNQADRNIIFPTSTDLGMWNFSGERIMNFRTEGNLKFRIGVNQSNFYTSLSMEGNNITNQSDIRLKSNIEDSQLDALREIERLRFIDFEWDKSKGAINENKPEERQFGLIAQYTPFLQTKVGESESYLSVDLTKQINLNSKGLQELLNYTRSLEKRIGVLENEQTE